MSKYEVPAEEKLLKLKHILEEIRDNEYTYPSSYWQLAEQGLDILHNDFNLPAGKKCQLCNTYNDKPFWITSCSKCNNTLTICKECYVNVDQDGHAYVHCNNCLNRGIING